MIRCFSLLVLLACFACQAQQAEYAYTNALIDQSSPYLLQHAHNPVNWHPWNDATLAKATAEDKMLLISVGYAACHWCHVMEHESFEDTAVARLMNENFVPVKVDREERPDVDNVYMTACQMATGRGCGWPLNAFALPDGRPVWAGTYFPKKEWLDVLTYFVNLRREEPEKLETYAAQLLEGIQQRDVILASVGDLTFSAPQLTTYADVLQAEVDPKYGGRKGAPKFPMPVNYELLLEEYHRTQDDRYRAAVEVTLDNLAAGGIYDQLGGGFSRYSVDAEWKVPHFEKMAYDNGQLLSLYSHAYQLTGKKRYRTVIEETVDFLERELSDPAGGFYSSLDADSEGEEGTFYTWNAAQLAAALPDEAQRRLFTDAYSVRPGGNWEDGRNTLFRRKTVAELADKHGLTAAAVETQLADARNILLAARAGRKRPGTDDKVLTGWNALLISGLADAHRALGTAAYRERAVRTGEFLWATMHRGDGRLLRNYKAGKAVINGFLDDYALLIQAYLDLYQITLDETYLQRAETLTAYVFEHFDDPQSGYFYYTDDRDAALIVRKKEIADNVIPSGNSVMARNLWALGTLLGRDAYRERARTMLGGVLEQLTDTAAAAYLANWLQLYQDILFPPYELVVIGPEADRLRAELQRQYLPHAYTLGGTTEGTLDLLQHKLIADQTTIYVCQNKVCKLPTTDAAQARELLTR